LPALRRSLTRARQRIEARRRSLESRRARRDDTRRRILVGAMVLAKVAQGVIQESVLRAEGPLNDSADYVRANTSLSYEDLSFGRLRTRTDFGSRGADVP
jgi:hypothetical protein